MRSRCSPRGAKPEFENTPSALSARVGAKLEKENEHAECS